MSDFYQPQNFGAVADQAFHTTFNVLNQMVQEKQKQTLQEIMLPLEIQKGQAQIENLKLTGQYHSALTQKYLAQAKAMSDAESAESEPYNPFGGSALGGGTAPKAPPTQQQSANPKEPASIRNNNPGAMWPTGASWQKQYGATDGGSLLDGLGQGNKIARFPDKVSGAAAELHLLSNYGDMPLSAAIAKWSGGNDVKSYLSTLQVAGFRGDEKLSNIMANKNDALKLAKTMANHEAGKDFGLDADGWSSAYDLYKQNKLGITQ